VRRDRHDPLLGQHYLFCKNTVHRSAERARHRRRGDRTVRPALEEAARDTIADAERRDALPQRHHLACCVGIRNSGVADAARYRVLDGREVAVVDGRRAHPHPHLAWSGFGDIALGEGESVDAVGGADFVGTHYRMSMVAGMRRILPQGLTRQPEQVAW
jgi:hypothetical protein